MATDDRFDITEWFKLIKDRVKEKIVVVVTGLHLGTLERH